MSFLNIEKFIIDTQIYRWLDVTCGRKRYKGAIIHRTLDDFQNLTQIPLFKPLFLALPKSKRSKILNIDFF